MSLGGDVNEHPNLVKKGVQTDVNTVVGVFRGGDAVQRAESALRDAGFSREEIAVVGQGTEAAQQIPSQAASDKATLGAAAGAVLGGLIGGVLAWLGGATTLEIPGIGPVLAILGGVLIGAAAGGWLGSLALRVPKDVAQGYARRAKKGDLLVMVLAEEGEEEQRAISVLREVGAEDATSYPYQARPYEFPGSRPQISEDDPGRERTKRIKDD